MTDLNRLKGRTTTKAKCPISANTIAAQVLKNGRILNADNVFSHRTSIEVTELTRAPRADFNLSEAFTVDEMTKAIKQLKTGKEPGRHNIHPEFILHQG